MSNKDLQELISEFEKKVGIGTMPDEAEKEELAEKKKLYQISSEINDMTPEEAKTDENRASLKKEIEKFLDRKLRLFRADVDVPPLRPDSKERLKRFERAVQLFIGSSQEQFSEKRFPETAKYCKEPKDCKDAAALSDELTEMIDPYEDLGMRIPYIHGPGKDGGSERIKALYELGGEETLFKKAFLNSKPAEEQNPPEGESVGYLYTSCSIGASTYNSMSDLEYEAINAGRNSIYMLCIYGEGARLVTGAAITHWNTTDLDWSHRIYHDGIEVLYDKDTKCQIKYKGEKPMTCQGNKLITLKMVGVEII